VGGLIFGIGFGLLGYCPGTAVGAAGQGSLDAMLGGVVGIIIGTGLLATIHSKIKEPILFKGDFGNLTLPKLFKVNEWVVVIPVAIMILGLLVWLEKVGL
jgi:uncharacterized membrane protein YedE/YeeE